MGFFSWLTLNDGKSISNVYSKQGALPIALLVPKEFGGGALVERCYEGYGEFAGQDAYALVARWNAPEKCTGEESDRHIGIEIGCYDEDMAKLKYPLKFVTLRYYEREHPAYEDLEGYSPGCPEQGYFYDDEEDEEDYE